MAALNAQTAGFTLAKAPVDGIGGGNGLTRRLHAHRGKAHHLAALPHRRGIGQHPVVVTILAPVLDHAGPGSTCVQVFPEIGKGFDRHIGVTHDVVRLAQQFVFGVAAGLNEIGIGKGDVPLQIGTRDGRLVVTQDVFGASDGLIVAHGVLVVKW